MRLPRAFAIDCSDFAAICVAYFKRPKAPTDAERDRFGNFDFNSCAEWKDQCRKTGRWEGPNCVIINVVRQ